MDLELRKVEKEHCDLLYKWANDSLARQNAFNTEIIEYEKHKLWFNNKLASVNSIIYIGFINNDIPVGQIRIDIENMIGIISYSIDKGFRGKGFGTQLLQLLKKRIIKDNLKVERLVGKVKYNNIASQKAFRKAGYIEKHELDSYIEYYDYI